MPHTDAIHLDPETQGVGVNIPGAFAEYVRIPAFNVVAPDGYSGNIEIMVGVDPAGVVTGVAILRHAETPGLGDKIALPAYTDRFRGQRLEGTDWRVKKDGGDFDQLTGATISPRAVVGAIRSGLEFFRDHREAIVAAAEEATDADAAR